MKGFLATSKVPQWERWYFDLDSTTEILNTELKSYEHVIQQLNTRGVQVQVTVEAKKFDVGSLDGEGNAALPTVTVSSPLVRRKGKKKISVTHQTYTGLSVHLSSATCFDLDSKKHWVLKVRYHAPSPAAVLPPATEEAEDQRSEALQPCESYVCVEGAQALPTAGEASVELQPTQAVPRRTASTHGFHLKLAEGRDKHSPVGMKERTEPTGSAAVHRPAANRTMETLTDLLHQLIRCNSNIQSAMNKQIAKVEGFYRLQSLVIASAASACVEASKKVRWMSSKGRKTHREACQEVVVAMNMLHSYCDHNILSLSEFVRRWREGSHQPLLKASQNAISSELRFALPRGCALELLKVDVLDAFRVAFEEPLFPSLVAGGGGGAAEATGVGETGLESTARTNASVKVRLSLAALAGAFFALMIPVTTDFFALGQPPGTVNNDYNWLHFTATAVLALMYVVFAVNTIIWEHIGVNYAFMLDLDVKDHWDGLELLRNAFVYLVIWALVAYAHLRTAVQEVQCSQFGPQWLREGQHVAWALPYAIWPLYLLVFVLFQTVWHPKGRKRWFLPTLLRVLQTPRYPVLFSDFILVVFFRSIAGTLFEMQWLFCVFQQEALEEVCRKGRALRLNFFGLLTLVWRLMQCVNKYYEPVEEERKLFPHAYNAMKYVVASFTIVAIAGTRGYLYYDGIDKPEDQVGGLLSLYFFTRSLDALYRGLWDVTVDCGLLSVAGPGKPYRCRELLLPRFVYVVFCVIDPLFRFRFLLSFHAATLWFPGERWTIIIWALMDLIRRFLWILVRFENEQVNNVELYKVTMTAPQPKSIQRGTLDSMWDDATEELVLLAQDGASGSPGATPLLTSEDSFAAFGSQFGGQQDESSDDDFIKEKEQRAAEKEKLPAPEGHKVTQAVSNLEVGKADFEQVNLFFAVLPRAERAAILRFALPTETESKFQAIMREGGGRRVFSELREELKAHALLSRLGRRTLKQYITDLLAVAE